MILGDNKRVDLALLALLPCSSCYRIGGSWRASAGKAGGLAPLLKNPKKGGPLLGGPILSLSLSLSYAILSYQKTDLSLLPDPSVILSVSLSL